MKNTQTAPKVVIIGGGFAGIEAAKALKKSGAQVTIVSKTLSFEYYPALYKLVTGALPIEVSVPLQTIFSRTNTKLIEATYTGLDQARQVVSIERTTGEKEELAYDYVVLAMGSETNYFNIPGLSELSYSFKSVKEALRLKRHFCELFATSATLTKDEQVSNMHIAIVGGGPSGVELAGDLKHYLRDVATENKLDPNLITIDLIEGGSRILPTMSEKVSKKAEVRLRKMGVNIFTGRALKSEEMTSIAMNGMTLDARTVVWTAGTRINQSFATIANAPLTERKRMQVTETLNLPGDNHVFIAGDGAGTQFSGLAQTAIVDGKYIGTAIKNMMSGKKVSAYKPETPSFVVPIGNYWALFNYKNTVFTGFLPWIFRSMIDFRYFTSIVPLSYVFAVFQKGKKYRKIKGGCSLE